MNIKCLNLLMEGVHLTGVMYIEGRKDLEDLPNRGNGQGTLSQKKINT